MKKGNDHMGTNRVNRGGSWNNNARNVRSAYRNHNTPGNRNNNQGFRCARAHAWTGWSVPEPVVILSVPGRQTTSGFRCVSRQPAESSPEQPFYETCSPIVYDGKTKDELAASFTMGQAGNPRSRNVYFGSLDRVTVRRPQFCCSPTVHGREALKIWM